MISNIDQMTRRELVEIVKIQVEEFQELHKRVAELERALVGVETCLYMTGDIVERFACSYKGGDV